MLLHQLGVQTHGAGQVAEDHPGVLPLLLQRIGRWLRVLLYQQAGELLATAVGELVRQRRRGCRIDRAALGAVGHQRVDLVDKKLLGLGVAPQVQHTVGQGSLLVAFPGRHAPALEPIGLLAGLGDGAGRVGPNRQRAH